MSDIYEKEVVEVVCSECSKTFETEDVNAEVCNECWGKACRCKSYGGR